MIDSKMVYFGSWNEAQRAFEEFVKELIPPKEVGMPSVIAPHKSGIEIGIAIAQFRFRLELTAEQERREKLR